MSHESWFIIHDFWLMIQDSWLMILDSWFMTHDSDPQCATWVIVSSDFFSHESWFFHYDLLFLNHESWFLIHDSWLMILTTFDGGPQAHTLLLTEIWTLKNESWFFVMNHESSFRSLFDGWIVIWFPKSCDLSMPNEIVSWLLEHGAITVFNSLVEED